MVFMTCRTYQVAAFRTPLPSTALDSTPHTYLVPRDSLPGLAHSSGRAHCKGRVHSPLTQPSCCRDEMGRRMNTLCQCNLHKESLRRESRCPIYMFNKGPPPLPWPQPFIKGNRVVKSVKTHPLINCQHVLRPYHCSRCHENYRHKKGLVPSLKEFIYNKVEAINYKLTPTG